MDNLEKEAYIFGLIFIIANRLQSLGDKMDHNITIKQWLFIATVLKSKIENPTISEIANMIGYSRQNVKKTALILEKQDFLKLVKDEKDERVVRIVLTSKCKEYFKTRANLELDFMRNVFKEFDINLTEGLFKGLKKLENNIIFMENENER